MFFMQSASFLAYQRTMEKGHGRSNCQTLFGIGRIPSDNYIRDFLDETDPALLQPCFERMEALLCEPPMRQAFGRLGGRTHGNWVKKSCADEACEEFIVPGGDLAPQTHGIFGRSSAHEVVGHVFDGAKLAGALSVRTRHSSSRKIMSNTQCRPFSIIQWPRTIGPIWWASRTNEVM